MRIKSLDVGVESVSLWQQQDEVHLPAEARGAPTFLPEYQALDTILNRPSLDERLPDLLLPGSLDPDLLEPSVLAGTREELTALFLAEARARTGEDAAAFEAAGKLMRDDTERDGDVRAALAMLLRG
ncbi:hypothetical protein [uncultured Aureimonas sp.]|uniref:type III secretion apparatus assembly protein SctX n=1 Tax=uncultured Aureimonas sp. TaxID=1604662 RepID=UPI0025ED8091|nr:hypothetical protein [uncultured Aureimonas sp.]